MPTEHARSERMDCGMGCAGAHVGVAQPGNEGVNAADEVVPAVLQLLCRLHLYHLRTADDCPAQAGDCADAAPRRGCTSLICNLDTICIGA